MAITLLETANLAVREIFAAPVVGSSAARGWGLGASAIIAVSIAWLAAQWLRIELRAAQWQAGALWAILTLMFDTAIARASDASWPAIASDYNPLHGGVAALRVLIMLFAPMIAMTMRRKKEPT